MEAAPTFLSTIPEQAESNVPEIRTYDLLLVMDILGLSLQVWS